ncbi:MAG: septal ring lytic transglycosylase RlpA family protein [Patescibacteria group bacterium]|nr:septal ring lytic transglycosylase RlpA family protein [Patescibacteria group bacterium]
MTIIAEKFSVRQCLYIAFAVFLFFLIGNPVQAQETVNEITLDNLTVERGYTVSTSDGIFRLGIMPGALDQEVVVTLKKFETEEVTLPQGKTLVSQIFEYDIINGKSPLNFSRPLALTLAYESDNYRDKQIYFWNRLSGEWRALPSRVAWDQNYVQAISYLPYSLIAVFEEPNPVHAPAKFDYLAADAAKGAKVAFTDASFQLELTPDAVVSRTIITLEDSPGLPAAVPDDLRLVSPLFRFQLKTEDNSSLKRPISLWLAYQSPNLRKKTIRYWDSVKVGWIELPGQTFYDQKQVQGFIHLPYAMVGVFESEEIYAFEGKASWYPSSKPYGAASNDFDFDTRLRVTNLENGKTVIVTIVSRGPFVPGRVIDLAKKAFNDIGNCRAGVIRVRVEKII